MLTVHIDLSIVSLITFKKNQMELTITPGFFDIPKKVVLVDMPYCLKNEEFSKRFMKKFDVFTDNKHDIHIKWITKKSKQLFKLKSGNPHPSCVI